MYFVYVLKSTKDGQFYIGQTNNVENRLTRHNQGRVKATHNRRPLELIYTESVESRSEAVLRENYLKSLKGGNEFHKIINKIN